MKRTWALLGLFLLPSLVFAAQFAPSALFLSEESVTEGDTVFIHAVVQNDGAAKFPGTLVITDGAKEIGRVAVMLAPGEVRAVSVSWKPAAGSHDIVAELQDSEGAVAQSESKTFVVKAKPKPAAKPTASSSAAAAVESSDGIQNQIDSLSPAVGGVLAPVFKLVDGGREAIADVLDSQLKSVGPKVTALPLPGVVAGAQTIKAPEEQGWFWSIVYTVYFYILTVLRYVVGSAGVFYPVLALLFFFILWRTYRRFRRS
ncbi:MAG TPA: hypothetical protein VJJ20_03430 [Candidatus Paceibacterota bacterium]